MRECLQIWPGMTHRNLWRRYLSFQIVCRYLDSKLWRQNKEAIRDIRISSWFHIGVHCRFIQRKSRNHWLSSLVKFWGKVRLLRKLSIVSNQLLCYLTTREILSYISTMRARWRMQWLKEFREHMWKGSRTKCCPIIEEWCLRKNTINF